MVSQSLLQREEEEHAPPLIDVDGTVALQFILFVVMFVVLTKFLFRPYLKVRGERHHHTEGAHEAAHKLEQQAEQISLTVSNKIEQARLRGAEEKARVRSEAATLERQIVGDARKGAETGLAKARQDVQTAAARAQQGVKAEAESLARQIADRLLGRKAAS